MSVDRSILFKTRATPADTVAAGSALFWLEGQTLKYKDDNQVTHTVSDVATLEDIEDLISSFVVSTNSKLTVFYNDAGNALELTLNEGNIIHQNLSGAGTNTHTDIDTHLATGHNKHRGVVGASFDGGSIAPVVGTKARIVCPFSGTIYGWDLISDTVGSAVVDIWKANSAVPTIADTIVAAAKPTLTAGQLVESTTLTGWTTAVTAGDVFIFNIDSVSGLIRLGVTLRINKT